ncbi:MAG: hypothetical protein WDM78_17975 [Puia sp.]
MDSLDDPGMVKDILSKDLRTLSSPAGFVMKPLYNKGSGGFWNACIKKIRQLQYDENFDLYDGHIISRDGRYMLLFVSPAYPADNTGRNAQILDGIDKIISGLQANAFDKIQANYFGGVAVAAGNALQLRRDSILTLSITSLFLILFISWYFKKKRAPFLILLPVVLGALFSLSIIYWIKGTISVIALAAGSIVLGIAINYSLHVYNHSATAGICAWYCRSDLPAEPSVDLQPLVDSFVCSLSGLKILKDLGLFAAFSLIGASLSSLIFLPQLIAETKSQNDSGARTERDSWIHRIADYHPEKNKWLIAAIFVLTIVFAFFVNRVGFDQDMMHMNYMSKELKKTESTLDKINSYSLRSVYLVTEGKNLEEALKPAGVCVCYDSRASEKKHHKKIFRCLSIAPFRLSPKGKNKLLE